MDACYKERERVRGREVKWCMLQRMVCCRELCVVVEVRGPSKKNKKNDGNVAERRRAYSTQSECPLRNEVVSSR